MILLIFLNKKTFNLITLLIYKILVRIYLVIKLDFLLKKSQIISFKIMNFQNLNNLLIGL